METERSQAKRKIELLEIMRERGEVTVNELADHFHVAAMTIRRDLHYYEQQGIVEVFYGGARIRETNPPFPDFAKRSEDHRSAKEQIARRAAMDIVEGDTVFLDASTTVQMMTEHLSGRSLTVVTNSLSALLRLTQYPQIKVIACPGVYKESYGGLMDYSTAEFLQNYYFQKAFLGASCCHPQFGVSCDEEIEAVIKRTVLERTKRAELLIGAHKMDEKRFIKICDVNRFDAVITNAELDQSLQRQYAQSGAVLVLC